MDGWVLGTNGYRHAGSDQLASNVGDREMGARTTVRRCYSFVHPLRIKVWNHQIGEKRAFQSGMFLLQSKRKGTGRGCIDAISFIFKSCVCVYVSI